LFTLAVVVYGIPSSNPLPRAANHRAQPRQSSRTVVSGRISRAMCSVLHYTHIRYAASLSDELYCHYYVPSFNASVWVNFSGITSLIHVAQLNRPHIPCNISVVNNNKPICSPLSLFTFITISSHCRSVCVK